jgi:DNA-binding GntR family transcriptional regulator
MTGTSPKTEFPRGGHLRAGNLYQALRRAIVEGELAPGERLVERALASKYSVSRTPVREAIHRLEMDGLVEITRSGAVVVDVSAEQLSDLCAVREALEGFASRLAATSASELDVQALRALLRASEQVVMASDVERQVELNHIFHETIWHSTRNRYLIRQLAMIRQLIERRGTTTLGTPGRQAESLAEHDAILKAIEARDPEGAESAAKAHFRKAMLLRLVSDRTGPREAS